MTSVKSTQKKLQPPAPFNTTAYTKAATALGFSAARAIRLAEDLYLGGFISYPRTDNTVYLSSLGSTRVPFGELKKSQELGAAVASCWRGPSSPTRGKQEQTTDHPPIYPVGVPGAEAIKWTMPTGRSGSWWRGVSWRRSAHEAVSEQPRRHRNRRGAFRRQGFADRHRTAGWASIPTAAARTLKFHAWKRAKRCRWSGSMTSRRETQPPGRYGQGRLIELMEQNGLGTKATRHSIIQNLYDRGYIKNTPVEPTETGVGMVEALSTYADRITKPAMTAELEEEMNSIAEQAMTKDEVVKRSRELLHLAYALAGGAQGRAGRHHRQGHPGRQGSRHLPQVRLTAEDHPFQEDQEAFHRLRRLPGLRQHLSAAADGQAHPHACGMPFLPYAQGQDHHPGAPPLGTLHRPRLPDQG